MFVQRLPPFSWLVLVLLLRSSVHLAESYFRIPGTLNLTENYFDRKMSTIVRVLMLKSVERPKDP